MSFYIINDTNDRGCNDVTLCMLFFYLMNLGRVGLSLWPECELPEFSRGGTRAELGTGHTCAASPFQQEMREIWNNRMVWEGPLEPTSPTPLQ